MEQAGIRSSQRHRLVSDYQLERLIDEGPGYQDWEPGSDWHPLAKRLHAQRLAPLTKHLAATDTLPAVKHLIIQPSWALANIPVQTFSEGYTVSYAPSGTLYAYLKKKLPSGGDGLLALADPAFASKPKESKPGPLPPGGVLLPHVPPGSNAASAGLVAADVLLKAIAAHAKENPIDFLVWRDGVTNTRDVLPGKLGVVFAMDPAPKALAAHPDAVRGPGAHRPLPGRRAARQARQGPAAAGSQGVRGRASRRGQAVCSSLLLGCLRADGKPGLIGWMRCPDPPMRVRNTLFVAKATSTRAARQA